MLARHPSSHRGWLSVGDGEEWRPQLPALVEADGEGHVARPRAVIVAMLLLFCLLRIMARPRGAARPATPGLTSRSRQCCVVLVISSQLGPEARPAPRHLGLQAAAASFASFCVLRPLARL